MADIDFLDFSALISSKICHDIIGPVGAMFNGFEVLEDDDDDSMHEYAMEVIQNNAKVVRCQLELARMVYGAGGSSGSELSIEQLQTLLANTLAEKHTLRFEGSVTVLPKDHAKLLSLLVILSVKALPRGGVIKVLLAQEDELSVRIVCSGKRAKFKEDTLAMLSGSPLNGIDALNIQSHYAHCMLEKLNGELAHEQVDEDEINLQLSFLGEVLPSDEASS